MKREHITVKEGLRQGKELPYSWICTISRVYLGQNQIGEIPLDELLEARFFNQNKEVRMFRREGELQAVVYEEQPWDRVLTQKYVVQNQALFGNELIVHQIIDVDEDGQCYVAATCLSGWKGGTAHG